MEFSSKHALIISHHKQLVNSFILLILTLLFYFRKIQLIILIPGNSRQFQHFCFLHPIYCTRELDANSEYYICLIVTKKLLFAFQMAGHWPSGLLYTVEQWLYVWIVDVFYHFTF